MTAEDFLARLQRHSESFARVVATAEGDWIVKGFIDIDQNVYAVSVDTKVLSKVLEVLLHPMLADFSRQNDLILETSPQQNFYPDITLIHEATGKRFAVDIKTTYRKSSRTVNGMTFGAYTGYFRDRASTRMTKYPYGSYTSHVVLGVLYDQVEIQGGCNRRYPLTELRSIPSVIRNFQFFAQPKYAIAKATPGSGNTKNIGAVANTDMLVNGRGPFANLGEAVFDDYWMFFLPADMAKAAGTPRPYTDLKSYSEYKSRGRDVLVANAAAIAAASAIDDMDEPQEDSDE